jgi:hypothetical protein
MDVMEIGGCAVPVRVAYCVPVLYYCMSAAHMELVYIVYKILIRSHVLYGALATRLQVGSPPPISYKMHDGPTCPFRFSKQELKCTCQAHIVCTKPGV